MAKGLRSKSKIASRNAKRYDPKTDYAITQAARLHQTASRLASKNKSNRTVTDEDAEEAGVEAMEQDGEKDDDVKAKVDENGEPTKVSTSGTRESRRETWRKAKGWKPKIGSKNGGRPKRRR
ncbi:unnamed protein product [Sympodiomycopsis kandeliae]